MVNSFIGDVSDGSLTLVDKLADINFGLPEDLAPHKKPWAYYEFLKIDRKASTSDIKKAVRRLSLENHPDRFVGESAAVREQANERQRLINKIGEVLSDDERELGEEYSKRHLYDKISEYGDFFGATHLEHKGYRTVTIAENLLDLLEINRRVVKSRFNFEENNPEIIEDIKLLEKAIGERDEDSAKIVHRRIVEKLAKKRGITPEEYEQEQEQFFKEYEETQREKDTTGRRFLDGLNDTIETKLGESNSTVGFGFDKMFDIFYNGEKEGIRNVHFGTSGHMICSVVGFDETEEIIKMGLKGAALLSGIKKVHFKAKHAKVTIADAHLEGIFQVVDGSVDVAYEGSSYGTIIRARAPSVDFSNDFIKSGDLYIPRSFETDGWEKREPEVDIAVLSGKVYLGMKQIKVQRKIDLIISNSFKDFISYSYKNDIKNNIKY